MNNLSTISDKRFLPNLKIDKSDIIALNEVTQVGSDIIVGTEEQVGYHQQKYQSS